MSDKRTCVDCNAPLATTDTQPLCAACIFRRLSASNSTVPPESNPVPGATLPNPESIGESEKDFNDDYELLGEIGRGGMGQHSRCCANFVSTTRRSARSPGILHGRSSPPHRKTSSSVFGTWMMLRVSMRFAGRSRRRAYSRSVPTAPVSPARPATAPPASGNRPR